MACSASMKAALPPARLGLGDHVQSQRRLAARLGAEDLDHPAARHSAHTQGQVERQRAGGDGGHPQRRRIVPEPHDGALAVLPLDLQNGHLQGLVLFHRSSYALSSASPCAQASCARRPCTQRPRASTRSRYRHTDSTANGACPLSDLGCTAPGSRSLAMVRCGRNGRFSRCMTPPASKPPITRLEQRREHPVLVGQLQRDHPRLRAATAAAGTARISASPPMPPARPPPPCARSPPCSSSDLPDEGQSHVQLLRRQQTEPGRPASSAPAPPDKAQQCRGQRHGHEQPLPLVSAALVHGLTPSPPRLRRRPPPSASLGRAASRVRSARAPAPSAAHGRSSRCRSPPSAPA